MTDRAFINSAAPFFLAPNVFNLALALHPAYNRYGMIPFEDVERKIERHHPDADLDLLRRAYIYSAKAHKDQVRASGEPYLIHPLSVAAILADMKMDVATVSTGLLHDVVEDTLAGLDDIRKIFGEDVASLVDGVTKISN